LTIVKDIAYEPVTGPDDPDDYRPGSRLALVCHSRIETSGGRLFAGGFQCPSCAETAPRGVGCCFGKTGGLAMVHTMARVEVAEFDTWLRVHRANAENRHSFGIVDGPIYQDIDEPNAVLVHTSTDDPVRAAQWFKTAAFKESTHVSGVLRRTFYTVTEG